MIFHSRCEKAHLFAASFISSFKISQSLVKLLSLCNLRRKPSKKIYILNFEAFSKQERGENHFPFMLHALKLKYTMVLPILFLVMYMTLFYCPSNDIGCTECGALLYVSGIKGCLSEQNFMPEWESAARSRICYANMFNWLYK